MTTDVIRESQFVNTYLMPFLLCMKNKYKQRKSVWNKVFGACYVVQGKRGKDGPPGAFGYKGDKGENGIQGFDGLPGEIVSPSMVETCDML